jgi:hypothetical protein
VDLKCSGQESRIRISLHSLDILYLRCVDPLNREREIYLKGKLVCIRNLDSESIALASYGSSSHGIQRNWDIFRIPWSRAARTMRCIPYLHSFLSICDVNALCGIRCNVGRDNLAIMRCHS